MSIRPAPCLRRLVVIDPSIAVTGALKGARNIARLATGFDQATLILPSASTVTARDVPEFDEVRYWPMPQIRRSIPSLAGYLPAILTAGWRLARWLRRDDMLVLNDVYLMQGAAARVAGYKGSIRQWVRIDPLRFPAVLREAWMAAIRRSGASVVAVSAFIARRLSDTGMHGAVLYDPVDPSVAAAADEARASRTPRDVVFLANYIEGKGQNYGLAAFARIAPHHPDARLLFFGGDMGRERNRAFRNQLEADAQVAGLARRVEFHGFATNLADAYRTAAVALILSESESYSLACLEAVRLGVPVIAFRSGGPEEIVRDRETGYLAPLRDVDAVAAALDALLSDPDEARRMGEAGAADVAVRFGDAAFAKGLAEIIAGP